MLKVFERDGLRIMFTLVSKSDIVFKPASENHIKLFTLSCIHTYVWEKYGLGNFKQFLKTIEKINQLTG